MSFDAKDYSISEILTKSVFDIPRNQRRYVWKKDRWNDLFEDLVFSISQKKAHFLGSFVLEEDSKDGGLSYYTIIDGQQRLTTITLLLLAIMKHFRENGMNDNSQCGHLFSRSLINSMIPETRYSTCGYHTPGTVQIKANNP